MFVATVAGIAAVVVADMAGHTLDVVVTIQFEVFFMSEGCRRPFVIAVTLAAIAGYLLVQVVLGRLVAGLTLLAGICLEQCMIKPAFVTEALHTSMIAMAREAVLFQQLLMEWRAGEWLGERLAKARQFPDLFGLVTGHAAFGRSPEKWRVTGKTVGFKFAVAGDQLARANHEMGISKGENGQNNQVDRKNDLERLAHRQPQNKKMLMM